MFLKSRCSFKYIFDLLANTKLAISIIIKPFNCLFSSLQIVRQLGI